MASSDSHPALVLYDIATHPPHTPYAPNPCKTRYALNFTKAPYRTEWVDIPDIRAVRTALHCPASRKFIDGSDFHTLPMLQDTTPGTEFVLGDSLDIACYLASRAAAWGGGALFPADSTRHGLDYSSPHIRDAMSVVPLSARDAADPALADYAHFNTHVDATFTMFVGLTVQNMARALPPASAARTKALFAQRAGVPAWDDLTAAFADAEKRAGLFRAFETGIAGLAGLYAQKEGPFLEGQTPSYADFVVGGWLRDFSQFLEQEEWAEFCTWHGGVFGTLHEVLQRQYWEVRFPTPTTELTTDCVTTRKKYGFNSILLRAPICVGSNALDRRVALAALSKSITLKMCTPVSTPWTAIGASFIYISSLCSPAICLQKLISPRRSLSIPFISDRHFYRCALLLDLCAFFIAFRFIWSS